MTGTDDDDDDGHVDSQGRISRGRNMEARDLTLTRAADGDIDKGKHFVRNSGPRWGSRLGSLLWSEAKI